VQTVELNPPHTSTLTKSLCCTYIMWFCCLLPTRELKSGTVLESCILMWCSVLRLFWFSDVFFVDENETLAPDYIVTGEFFDQKIRELVLRYNYTLNPEGIYQAIKYMYTYWPDSNNTYYIRERYIDVSGIIKTVKWTIVFQFVNTQTTRIWNKLPLLLMLLTINLKLERTHQRN
jgi:hypothetical protein